VLNIASEEKPANAPTLITKGKVGERERMETWLKEKIAASQRAPTSEVVTLTPVLAQILLERNPENRSLLGKSLNRLTRDVEGGRWELNGETVIISKDGKLNNGQHRCHAVINANRPISVVMVFGVTRSSRMTLDMGASRTVGHFLSMKGYTDYNQLAALANFVWQWETNGAISQTYATKTEALAIVEKYDILPECLQSVSKKGASAIASKTVLGFCYYAFWQTVGRKMADEFMGQLIDGDALAKGSAILYCRNRLIAEKEWFKARHKIELIFKSWNAWRKNEPTARILIGGKQLPELEK